MENICGKIKVILRTKDKTIVSAFVDERPPKGVTITFEERPAKGMLEANDVAVVVISALLSVPTSLFANWLWSKIKDTDKSATNITINNQSVNISRISIFHTLHIECNPKGGEESEQGDGD